MRYLCLLLSFFLPMAVFAEEQAPPNAAQAYQIVLKAGSFSLGGIGVAGTISETEKAFDVILKEPDAAAQFAKLLSSSTPAGQLYALYGLKKTDESAYQRALSTLKKSDAKVEEISGCEIGETTVSVIAKQIEARKSK